MNVKEYNHRIVIEEIDAKERVTLENALKVKYYRYAGKGRRIYDKTVNLLYKEDGKEYFPPGMLEYIGKKFDKINSDIYVDDCRSVPYPHLRLSSIKREDIWKNQEGAISAIKENEDNNVGFISSIMGSGKSRIIEEITKLKRVNTLIIVPTDAIKMGLLEKLSEFIPKKMITTKIPKESGFFAVREIMKNSDNYEAKSKEDEYLLDKGFKRYGGNWIKTDKATNSMSGKKKKEPTRANIVITCFQSLTDVSQDYLDSVELVIVDEGHTARNATIRNTLMHMPNAYYRYFLSATFWADLKEDMILLMSAASSNLIFEELPIETIKDKRVAEPVFITRNSPTPKHPVGHWVTKKGKAKIVHTKDFDEMVKLGIVGNSTQNDDVCEVALDYFDNGDRCLICVHEEIHGHILQETIEKKWIERHQSRMMCKTEEQLIQYIRSKDENRSNFDNLKKMDLVYIAQKYASSDFSADYIFGRENKKIKREIIKDASYGQGPGIFIGTKAVGIGVDTKNINRVLLVDLRKSSTAVLQGIGRGGRVKDYTDEELDNYSFEVVNWDNWFHPKLKEHAKIRMALFEEYFLGKTSMTKKRWNKIY